MREMTHVGVRVREAIGSSLAIAVALGLVVGKTVGIGITAYLGVRLGLARLPEGVRWPTIVSGALLSGIGFTMSLFIASLGLEGDLLESAKSGILLGSLVAGVGGFLLLRRFLPAPQPHAG